MLDITTLVILFAFFRMYTYTCRIPGNFQKVLKEEVKLRQVDIALTQ